VTLEAETIPFLEKDPKAFLEGIIPAIGNYDYVAVYKTANGRFEYYGNFKVEKDLEGKIHLTSSKARLKRPVDNIHKFWARKPWWAVSQYIMGYSKEGDTVCDPMCGCGIAGYEALRLKRRVILVDLNPFAMFLTKNTIMAVDGKQLLSAFEEVLNRPIEGASKVDLGQIISDKCISIKDSINALYKTRCRICQSDATAIYFVWDTVLELREKPPQTPAGKILLEALLSAIEPTSSLRKISQLALFEKWEEVLNTARGLWEAKRLPDKTNPFIGPPRPTLVTTEFGKLVREGIFKRAERKPVLVFYECNVNKKHKALVPLEKSDFSLISNLEKVKTNYQFPDTQLRYPNGQLFDTARPDSLFVPVERLATYAQSELRTKDERMHHLFTKRNLIALSTIYWSISRVSDINIREKLLLAFTKSLALASKLHPYRALKRRPDFTWNINRFSIPPTNVEYNVFALFDMYFSDIYSANEQAQFEITDFISEAEGVDDFVRNSKKTALFLREDVKNIAKIFANYKDVVDMVFTDPPYGAAIQYYELCTFWVSWLLLDPEWKNRYGDMEWWQNEIIVNKIQGKPGLEKFRDDLAVAFQSISGTVKDEATWVITYHKREPGYWKALTDAQGSIGLGFYDEDRHQLLGRSFNPSKDFKFLETDAYTIWKQFPISRARTFEEAAEAFFKIITPFVSQHNGILPRTAIEKAYVEMAWTVEKSVYEQFFEGKYDVFLEKHSIQIPTKNGVFAVLRRDSPPPNIPSEKWQTLWDSCYGRVDPGLLIKYTLTTYIKGRYEREIKTSLDDIYHDIVSRINGRISQDIVFAIIDEIAEYDWLDGTYKPRKGVKKIEGLTKWMPKKELRLPEPPESLIPKLAVELIKRGYDIFIGKGYEKPDISRVYERKIIKRVRSDLDTFPIVITKNGIPIACIDVNTLSRASHALLRGDVKIIILYAMKEIIQKSSFYKKHIEEGKLVLLDVQNKTTTDVMDAITQQIGE